MSRIDDFRALAFSAADQQVGDDPDARMWTFIGTSGPSQSGPQPAGYLVHVASPNEAGAAVAAAKRTPNPVRGPMAYWAVLVYQRGQGITITAEQELAAAPAVGAQTLLCPDEANVHPQGGPEWQRVRDARLAREARQGRPVGLRAVRAGGVLDDIARKEKVELGLKVAAVGVAAIGAVGLVVYALRR